MVRLSKVVVVETSEGENTTTPFVGSVIVAAVTIIAATWYPPPLAFCLGGAFCPWPVSWRVVDHPLESVRSCLLPLEQTCKDDLDE